MSGLLRAGAAVVLAALIAAGIAARLRALAASPEPAAHRMAAIVDREVEPGATIESLEWELDLLVQRPFHHPPPFVPAVPYDVPETTAYLVDGPMAKAVGLYGRELERYSYRHVASVGGYDLYRRAPRPARARPRRPHRDSRAAGPIRPGQAARTARRVASAASHAPVATRPGATIGAGARAAAVAREVPLEEIGDESRPRRDVAVAPDRRLHAA